MNRTALSGGPTGTMSRAPTWNGVMSFFRYSGHDMPIKSLSMNHDRKSGLTVKSLMAFLLRSGSRFFVDPVPVPDRGVHHAEERRPDGEYERHRGEKTLGPFDHGPVRQVRREVELLEGHPGKIQPVRPTGFVLAVDMVDVLVGMLRDPFAGHGDQVVPLPERERARGAGLGAGRYPAVLESRIVAHGALHDLRVQGAFIIVGRDVEGAGDHAVPASEAEVGIVLHRALRTPSSLMCSGNRRKSPARRNAGIG